MKPDMVAESPQDSDAQRQSLDKSSVQEAGKDVERLEVSDNIASTFFSRSFFFSFCFLIGHRNWT